MQKIISLFARNYDGDRLVRDELVSGSEWVVAGEGVATVKWDGTCCKVEDGQLYKRYDAKKGKQPPLDFRPAQPEADPVSGHWPGWVPVGPGPADAWHREAWENMPALPSGTYELVGPCVQGNPYALDQHMLWLHGAEMLFDAPRDFAGLRAYFEANVIEGIVWHHTDGRLCKLKRRDFNLPWPEDA